MINKQYLHQDLNHHPRQKHAVVLTFVLNICEPQYIEGELQHLNAALQTNDFTAREVKRALQLRRSDYLDVSVEWDITGLEE